MKTMADYISELLKKHGIDTDDRGWQKQAAHLIGISEPTMSAHQHGRAVDWSEKSAIKIADELGVSRAEVLLCAQMERAKDDEIRKVWEMARRKLGSAAAGAMFAVALIGSLLPQIPHSVLLKMTLYIMSNGAKRLNNPVEA